MFNTTEIAERIYRISMWDEPDLADILFPHISYNLFLIAADKPAIINTMFRRSFKRMRTEVSGIIDPASLRYVVVPHHEGDSSGAINEWLAAAPEAAAVCSELCAVLSLRDFANKDLRVISDGEVIDLGSHRLRFLMSPMINQWDSLMVYEERTRTLFPNDLFSQGSIEVRTTGDVSRECLESTHNIGYQPNDRGRLMNILDKIEPLPINSIAVMHGPVITSHFQELFRTFRENSVAYAKA